MQPLLNEINAFLSETGMHPQIFGRKACRNGRLVERLQAGGRVWPETEDKVRRWIWQWRAREENRAA